ncbi:MAG: hypothetical protein Fur0015_08510 [Ignavibacteriales bacterium]
MKRLIQSIAIIFVFLFSACSTVLNSTTQEIEIKSNPENARIIIDGKKFGLTPNVVNLERGVNHIIKLEFEGYETYESQITRKLSNWFWGNALNLFVPGMATDYLTGSMYNLLPQKISVELNEEKTKKDKK